ncbi:multicopper oxidase family protein [Aquipuribacter sp. SD81]|uniref:multicopper oxidase family protein n=1 Tax=Aquipuribacter sp. SD81 TaxID=3127703 RepID=UPI0030160EA5
MARTRPTVLVVVAVALVVPVLLAITGVALVATGVLSRPLDTRGEVAFERPLRVPELAASTVEPDGTRVFDLTLQQGETDLTGRGPTRTWGVDGAHLAPTLRAARGETVRIDVENTLPEATNLHWHGHRLPAAMDGGPHTSIAPGATWSPTWTVDQAAATTWYHPHLHGSTAAHLGRGLAGVFLLDDPANDPGGLPGEYGVDDVPLLLQDVRLDRDGTLRDVSTSGAVGGLGSTVLVNGTVGPYLDVTTEAVRLRVVNASTSRVYDLGLADGRALQLVATDGGLLPAPVTTASVPLSPGERAEVVVRLEPGERVVLRSTPPELGVAWPVRGMSGARDAFDLLELRAADDLRASPPLPARLADAPDLTAADATVERTFELGDGQAINGRELDMGRVDEVLEAGTVERWTVRNADGIPHSFHVHDAQMAVAAVDGAPPPPRLGGWKDTLYVPPGGEVELVFRVAEHVDPDRPYVFHCHLLVHHDRGMMGQFVVVAPGTAGGHPGTVDGGTHGHGDLPDDVAAIFPGALRHP